MFSTMSSFFSFKHLLRACCASSIVLENRNKTIKIPTTKWTRYLLLLLLRGSQYVEKQTNTSKIKYNVRNVKKKKRTPTVIVREDHFFLWLLKTYFARDDFWWMFTWDTNILTLGALSESSMHKCLIQISFLPILQSSFKLWSPSQIISHYL